MVNSTFFPVLGQIPYETREAVEEGAYSAPSHLHDILLQLVYYLMTWPEV